MAVEALLFPGQGLRPQEIIGFHQSLYRLNPQITQRWMDLVQKELDVMHGPNQYIVPHPLVDGALPLDENSPDFSKTEYVQPLIYGLSMAAFESLVDYLNPEDQRYFAGYSLGECAAVSAAGGIDHEAMLKVVIPRGRLMQEIGEEYPSKHIMLWDNLETVQELCAFGVAQIALISAPKLVVVGCDRDMVPKVEKLATALKIKRSRVLNTSAAFHTFRMEPAASGLEYVLYQQEAIGHIRGIQYSVVANLTGKEVNSEVSLIPYFVNSMVRPVQWVETMETFKCLEVDRYIEVGPGNSLKALAKLNNIPEEKVVNALDLITGARVPATVLT